MAIIDDAKKSVDRIQSFDANALPRMEELGQALNFCDAVEPAQRLISLYKRVSLDALEDYPDDILINLKERANADYALFDGILTFSVKGQGSPEDARDRLISGIKDAYQRTFSILCSIVSYSVCRTTDFRLVEDQAKGVLQGIKDNAEHFSEELQRSKEEGTRILEDIRKVAAEQGVSQQAIYFKNEAERHASEADKWKKHTWWAATGLVLVAFAMLFLSKWSWLTPTDNYSALQLVTSKMLIFATLSYVLYMCGKNFLSHKHNQILNQHRQNSLMTYKAIVDASGTPEGKELILAQAAHCMFSPQDTGYIKVVPSGDSAMKAFVDSIPRTTVRVD